MRPAALREAHAHIAQHGRAMTMLDLSGCRGVADCLQRTAAHARDKRSGDWVLGHAVRIESWSDATPPRWPTAAELDAAVGDRPCCLWSFDHHGLVVNTAGLRAARITDSTPDPDHGRIVRDRHGAPTGLMLESAAKLIWRSIPDPTPEERLEMVAAGAADLARHGFVEVNDLLSEPWLGPVLAQLDDAGRLPLRVAMYPRLEDLDAVLASRAAFERPGGGIRLAGAKLFADGTLNARTASMLHP